MDLQWKYNDIQIKEEDKQKTAFTTSKGLFKPTVIFFRLTNSPKMFQTMMNKILQNLINTRKMVIFIDDVIISTEEKEEYNELVKKVVRRLAENDLYVKLEKCKQKVRKVEFLEVIIGLERIKIGKAKVKDVLDWLIPKYIKGVQKFLGLANYYC